MYYTLDNPVAQATTARHWSRSCPLAGGGPNDGGILADNDKKSCVGSIDDIRALLMARATVNFDDGMSQLNMGDTAFPGNL